MLDFESYVTYLRRGFGDFFSDIERVDMSIFVKKDYQQALGFLTQANSFVDSLKLLRLVTEDLERSEFQDLIHKFDVYNREVKNNIFDNHSHQWSDIEYRHLISACNEVGSLLNISTLVPKVS